MELRVTHSFVPSISPQVPTVTVKGAGVDLSLNGHEEIATISINLGTWTDGTHTFAVQESVDDVDGDYADAAVADLAVSANGTLDGSGHLVVSANTGNPRVVVLTYLGAKRWIRVVDTITGSPSTGAQIAATVIFGKRYAGTTPGGSNAAFN